MKQFVKALDKEGECFKYLCEQFPGLSDSKLKKGIFVGSDIGKLLKDETFVTKMEMKEKNAWSSFKRVVTCFLGNKKDQNYKDLIAELLQNYKVLGGLMSVKVHFLHTHLDYFPENLGAVSEEQGERFHQDIKEMERRYQCRWNVNMMEEYCQMLKRENSQEHNRKNYLQGHILGRIEWPAQSPDLNPIGPIKDFRVVRVLQVAKINAQSEVKHSEKAVTAELDKEQRP
ncbi:uncharacterized protein TNCV_5048201 [Trichonephila clavipes]|nr:uncharacterized protein TNCV_5048201 [Trichonephila clavipes]